MRIPHTPILLTTLALAPAIVTAQAVSSEWTFAVSGDSRNCGDFVMPAIAAKVKAEKDAFYWHLGDFRAYQRPDQDLVAMQPAGTELSRAEYQRRCMGRLPRRTRWLPSAHSLSFWAGAITRTSCP